MKRLIAAALLAATSAAQAAPFAITYTGTLMDSTRPGIHDGQRHRVTYIMDNGGATAQNQAWTGVHLTCVLWRVNDDDHLLLRYPLRGTPDVFHAGQILTDATGMLTQMLDWVWADNVRTGITPPAGVTLQAPLMFETSMSTPNFFDRDLSSGSYRPVFSDSVGGISMVSSDWSAPRPVAGPCDDAPPGSGPGPGGVQPVPALGLPALALLGMGAAGLGAWRLRRR